MRIFTCEIFITFLLFLSAEDQLTLAQADQAVRQGEAAYYQSKINELDKRCSQVGEREKESNQLKSDLLVYKDQLREQKLHYDKRINVLENEINRMKTILPCSSAQQNDIPHYNVPRSTRSSHSRPSNHTYISMKDSDPHYESIHSSMLQVCTAIFPTFSPQLKHRSPAWKGYTLY